MSLPTVDKITQQLKGQKLRLPNLFQFYAQWPNEISPYYQELRTVIETKIQEWISPEDENVRRKARMVDLPLFCATWYPRSSLDRLETMAWYSMWLFLWDDVVEDSAIPTSASENKVDWLHEHALRYVKFHLGLSDSGEEPTPPTKYCTLFKHCATSLRAACTEKERKKLYETVEEYMTYVGIESQYVARKELPTLREYWEHRLGTSSVNTYCALGEYMGSHHLPEHLIDGLEVRSLWYELNRHIVTMNDIVSLKKEIGKSLHSLVPVIINETGDDLDVVIASLVELLRISGENIDKSSERLLALTEHDVQARASVEAYLAPFWTIMTGNYRWSLICDRYGVTKYLQRDGALVVPL